MRKSDIVIGTDEDNDTIISLAIKRLLSKNHQGGLDGSDFSSAGVSEQFFVLADYFMLALFVCFALYMWSCNVLK